MDCQLKISLMNQNRKRLLEGELLFGCKLGLPLTNSWHIVGALLFNMGSGYVHGDLNQKNNHVQGSIGLKKNCDRAQSCSTCAYLRAPCDV